MRLFSVRFLRHIGHVRLEQHHESIHDLWKECSQGSFLIESMTSYLTKHIAHYNSDELGLLSPSFLSFFTNFSAGRYLSKWLRSFINLEFIPRLVDIVNPNILLLTTNITIPTTTNAINVVNENNILNTTNYTING